MIKLTTHNLETLWIYPHFVGVESATVRLIQDHTWILVVSMFDTEYTNSLFNQIANYGARTLVLHD